MNFPNVDEVNLWVSDHCPPPTGELRFSTVHLASDRFADEVGNLSQNQPGVAFFAVRDLNPKVLSNANEFKRRFPHFTRILVTDQGTSSSVNVIGPQRGVTLAQVSAGIWQEALIASREALSRRQLIEDFKQQNRQLVALTEDLQAKADERTRVLSISKLEMEAKTSELRAVVRFVKELVGVLDLDGLLQVLRKEFRSFHRVQDPILALPRGTIRRLHYFQRATLTSKAANQKWPSSNRIRVNELVDRQYLADQFGRPFAKVLAVPIEMKTERRPAVSLDEMALLYVENSLEPKEVDQFVDFLRSRLQPFTVALDRLLLEGDLRSASVFWEGTFDSLTDPVAILDVDLRILRSNRAFQNLFDRDDGGAPLEELLGDGGQVRRQFSWEGRFLEMRLFPIEVEPTSMATTAVLYVVDLTTAKDLQSRMIQSEKMVAVGQLAGNIAHELNNPLTGVRSLSQLLLRQVPEGQQVHADLVEVEKASERCQLIIKNLLEFSRNEMSESLVRINLNDVIERTLPLVKTSLRGLNCHVELSPEPLWIEVAPQLMQQVVFNLVNNAGQATAQGGEILIESRKVEGRAHFVVRDSGRGIAENVLPRIFEPFFTTKGPGQGTGLGLNMSLNIVRRFGGEIRVESAVGVGSSFTVDLPLEVRK